MHIIFTFQFQVQTLPDENTLLQRIANSDKEAFTQLFNHYHSFVFTYGRKLTKSNELAINLLQEVFLKVWEGRSTLIRVENFGAYLNRIVRNKAFNMLRDMVSLKYTDVPIEGLDWISDVSTLQNLDYKETVELVDQTLKLLSPQQRKAYELCHKQGLKYEQAAIEMGISPQTAHVHMKLELSTIRDHLIRDAYLYPLLAFALVK